MGKLLLIVALLLPINRLVAQQRRRRLDTSAGLLAKPFSVASANLSTIGFVLRRFWKGEELGDLVEAQLHL